MSTTHSLNVLPPNTTVRPGSGRAIGGYPSNTSHSATHNHHANDYSMNRKVGAPGSNHSQAVNSVGNGVRHESVVEDQRRISSVIVREEYLQGTSAYKGGEEIKYVEVPFVEEVVRTVPRKEIIEVEKIVPKIEYQYVDRTVEVPRIEYVDRIVEVPKYEEEIKYVTKQEYVDVPREVIEEVPVIEKRVKEEIVEVPGQIIEVPRRQIVEQEIVLPRYIKEEQPVVVAQTLRPQFVQSRDVFKVNVNHYEAEIVEVEVPVAKIVDLPLRMGGIISESHVPVDVSAAQYNSILKILNPHVSMTHLSEAAVLRRDGSGFPELGIEDARRFMPLDAGHGHTNKFQVRSHSRRQYLTQDGSAVQLRPFRPSPAINASPPYASNVGINTGIATFPTYESSYHSLPKSSKHSRRRHNKGK